MSNPWNNLFEEAKETVQLWRAEEQQASLAMIEDEVDVRLAKLRARMIQDLALSHPTRDIRKLPKAERPVCSHCQAPLLARGKKKRTVVTNHEQAIELERSQGSCSQCDTTFFPPR